MIDKNKMENIREEIERASQTMSASTLLFDNNLINDAVSRLFYFLLYNIRALLLTKGLEPKSHEGALRLFALHFIKEKIFEPKDSHVFSKLMKYREEADCNPSYVFTKDDFTDFKKEAEALSIKIKSYLKNNRYL